jgi:diguanylate cyclase
MEKLSLDSLTGMLDRKSFFIIYKDLLEKAHTNKKPLSIAFIDIDQFLVVNETYGHTFGDAVLQRIATQSREIAGPDAVITRYGGDEFVVILPETEREEAFLLIEKLRLRIESQEGFQIEQKETDLKITISAGVASFPVDGRGAYELLRKADQALYRAKQGNRNLIRLAVEEKLVPKTSHYTQTQLERLSRLALGLEVGEAELLREAMDDLLMKYTVNEVLSL